MTQFKKLTIQSRRVFAFIHDMTAVVLALYGAYFLRFNLALPSGTLRLIWQLLVFSIPLHAAFFIGFGLYQGIWRFASILDLRRILLAVLSASIIGVVGLYLFKPAMFLVPRSVLIFYPILLILMMGGTRLLYRAYKEQRLHGETRKLGLPVIIFGAGEAAVTLVKELDRSSQWRVEGLLDDDLTMIGRQISGVKVLGPIAKLESIYKDLQIQHVIIALPSATHMQRRAAAEIATKLNVEVLTVPAIDDLMSGKVSVSHIRPVDVEDLLGRDAVLLDNSGLQDLIAGSVVMVSGAAGSIGSELCRQIVKFKPNKLLCYDISEYSLYQLEQQLSALNYPIDLHYIVGDVKNKLRVEAILSQYKPSLVFHAAAYKHVPLMEHENVLEAIKNNALGTHVLAQACKNIGVAKFVFISTDKAVNPTNVMGASKRLAELVCQSLNTHGLNTHSATKFVTVRFGNVLGSSGSVIPKFREQIASGGPLTVTHPDITRYFMSIPEAAQLVMQAGLMGKGGEIFVLDMGEPVKIADLAKDMIHLSGFHEEDIKIEYTGLRPGEKLFEELLADDELTRRTTHPKLRIAEARSTSMAWLENMLVWIDSCQFLTENDIKKQLSGWVEEYNMQEAILPTKKSNVLNYVAKGYVAKAKNTIR